MRIISLLIPFLTTLGLLVLVSLPWGQTSSDGLAVAILPLIAVHFWSVRRPRRLPAPAVFLLGFLADVVGQGPIGFWALLYLICHAVSMKVCEASGLRDGIGGWLACGFTIAIVAVFAWGIGSLFSLSWFDAGRFVAAAALAIAVYPLAAVVLGWADRRGDALPAGVLHRAG